MGTQTWSDEQLIEAVKAASCISDVIRSLGLQAKGGNFQTIRKHMIRLGLDDPGWRKRGVSPKGTQRRYSLSEILVRNSTYASSSNLKHRLWKEGLLDRRCYECGITEWYGRPAPLELEHINGDKLDNRLDNLSILCPNCHAFTSTYRGKNSRWAGTGPPKIKPCIDCGLPSQGKRCRVCWPISQERISWPSLEELTRRAGDIGFSALGRELGVSDNAIRKRIRNHP